MLNQLQFMGMSSIYIVLHYLSMYIRAWLSHAYIAARRSERACKSPSSVYIEVAARLAPFLVSFFFGCF